MKVPKEARRAARQLFRSTIRSGKLDADFARQAVAKIIETKPRHYLPLLEAYQRLLRAETERRHATIESAIALGESEKAALVADLRKSHGDDITAEFKTNPDLLGGLRIKLGSTVWDGSLKTRLQALREKLTA